MDKYDIIIIGGACAGMSAAIYSARRALRTLVLTKDIGGQIATTTEVENYPGIFSIMGPQLALNFKKQAETSGAEIKTGLVSAIKKQDDGFLVQASTGEFLAQAIILAFGLKQRTLNVPGEKELTGHGVAYCATCDAPFYKNKKVAVVGGGNSAFDATEYLSGIASEVHLLVRTDQYKAESSLIRTVKEAQNVTIHDFTEIKEFIGEKKLEKVILRNLQTSEEKELALDGVFIEIGWESQSRLIEGLSEMVELDEKGYVIVDNQNQTSTPGIYAAGDVTNTPFKQAVISAGEGAKASMSAARYIQKKRGENGAPGLVPDWTKRVKVDSL